jgi:preprotein translocase subunit Sss1
MNNNNKNSPPTGGAWGIEERLWNFIDGTVSASEKTVIEQLLESDAEWKAKYHELLQVNELLKSSELEEPSMRFTKNVMEEISKLHIAPATKSYINKKIIWGIGIFFITLLVGFLIYGFGQMDWTAGQETTLSKNINKFDLSKVDFSKFFSNTWVNAFMMINVVLGLVLLDNFLTNKRKEFRKQM